MSEENPPPVAPPAPPPSAPPVQPNMSSVPPPGAYVGQPYPGPPSDANEDPLRFVVPLNPSWWCMAAGYLGLFSLLLIFGPFALLAGIMGVRDVKQNPTKTGIGRAWFGVVMGGLATGLMLFFLILSLIQK